MKMRRVNEVKVILPLVLIVGFILLCRWEYEKKAPSNQEVGDLRRPADPRQDCTRTSHKTTTTQRDALSAPPRPTKSQKLVNQEWSPGNELLTYVTPKEAPLIADDASHLTKEQKEEILRKALACQNYSSQSQSNYDTDTGAFCITEADKESKTSHYPLLTKLCQETEKFLEGKSVADFGTGFGYFGRCLLRLNSSFLTPTWGKAVEERDFLKPMTDSKMWDTCQKIASWSGYDAAGNIESVTSGFVKYFDLTKPRYLGRTFDWVICFEVGEHIPKKYERIFFENLIRHAKEGIIISWAVPCIKCTHAIGHVNEQPNVYVAQRFAPYGFEWDDNATVTLRNAAQWRKQSLMVFRRAAT